MSKLPLARYFPSGLNATEYTGSLCLVRVWVQVPLSTSHSRTVESKLADASTRGELGLFVPGPRLVYWRYELFQVLDYFIGVRVIPVTRLVYRN